MSIPFCGKGSPRIAGRVVVRERVRTWRLRLRIVSRIKAQPCLLHTAFCLVPSQTDGNKSGAVSRKVSAAALGFLPSAYCLLPTFKFREEIKVYAYHR